MGIAITLLLPGMLLILIAGVLADRIGLRRQAAWSQLLAGLMPLLLAVAVYIQALSFTVMIIFALLSGCASAFLTPARDGLLNHVAGEDVQRTVMQASLCQFGFQILGYSLAGFADTLGAEYILVTQSLVLLLGVWAYTQLREVTKASDASDDAESVFTSLSDGARTVISSPLMRTVVLQNVIWLLFHGCLCRRISVGNAGGFCRQLWRQRVECAQLSGARREHGGVFATWVVAGQALVLAQAIGSVVLLTTGLVDNLSLFMFLVFMWGVCGGIAMPMSRTLMQQLAPPDQRARVMSFYAFSFMGAGPLGTLICGYLADLFGPQQAIVISAVCMLLVLAVISLFSPLWRSELEQIQSA